MSINLVERKNGYIPDELALEGPSYRIDLVSKNGKVLSSKEFVIPNELQGPPPLPGEKEKTDKPVILDRVEFALNIPFSSFSDSIRIYDPNLKLITTYKLSDRIPVLNNKPNFKTTEGDELNRTKPSGLLQKINNLFLDKAYAQTASTTGYLDIAIIPDKYSDMNAFPRE